MSRISGDEIDEQGTVKNGFDYNLQIWVRNYICQDVGAGSDKHAGQDIRNIPDAEKRVE